MPKGEAQVFSWLRHWFKEQWAESQSRAAGRKALGVDRDQFQTTRGITGMTGASLSGAYELLEKDDGAYIRSMQKEPVLPPSLFVSERDRVRYSEAVPLAERCIEDVGRDDAVDVRDWDIRELDATE